MDTRGNTRVDLIYLSIFGTSAEGERSFLPPHAYAYAWGSIVTVLAVRPSVCLSVCLSELCTVIKRQHISG